MEYDTQIALHRLEPHDDVAKISRLISAPLPPAKASGQAVVSRNGNVVYLGEFNSAKNQQKHRRLLAEAWRIEGKK